MASRVAIGGLLFAFTGCFSEPPSSSGGEGPTSGTTSAVGSSSGPTSGSDAGMSTSGPEGSSSSGGFGPGSSSTGECFEDVVQPPLVDADVVLLLDNGVTVDTPLGEALAAELQTAGTHVAVFTPTVAGSPFPISFDCESGCGTCEEPAPRRVRFPYVDSVFAAVGEAIASGGLGCVLRPSPPGGGTSGPAKHLWVLTGNPEQNLPAGFEAEILAAGFRLHVACPQCNGSLPNDAQTLQSVLDRTFGTVADSGLPGQVAGQGALMVAGHVSCRWPSPGSPVDLQIFAGPPAGDSEEYFFYAGEQRSDCGQATEDVGYFFDGADLELCPFACYVAQEWPAMSTEIITCE